MRCLALMLACWVALTGCSEDSPAAKPPALGGTVPTGRPPATPMDDLEKPIASRLATQVADQGLHVDHLDCPQWDGEVPAELTCMGWFDHVPGEVTVSLTREKGGAVGYDAVLEQGVIATKKLVAELVGKGYDDVDCGTAPAYPTDVGSTITCRVRTADGHKYVTATITDDHGGVTISDF